MACYSLDAVYCCILTQSALALQLAGTSAVDVVLDLDSKVTPHA